MGDGVRSKIEANSSHCRGSANHGENECSHPHMPTDGPRPWTCSECGETVWEDDDSQESESSHPAAQLLHETAELVETKNEDYSDADAFAAKMMAELADGEVTLSEPSDYLRLILYAHRFEKLSRSWNQKVNNTEMNFEGGAEADQDAAGYAARQAVEDSLLDE